VNVQLIILIVYAAGLLLVASWSTRLQKKASANKMLSYLLAGRNMPTPLVVCLLVGLAVGGASTVGVAERAYTKGLSAGWYNAAWGMGGIAVGLFAASRLRRLKVKTVPEMMGLMFGPETRLLSVAAQLLVLISITSLQYVAGGSILTALLPGVFPDLRSGMMASALIFIAITVVGGYWASGLTNLVNVIVIYVGIFAALGQSMGKFGGMEAIKASLPAGDHWFDPISGLGILVIVAQVIVMITMAFTTQAVTQITFAARDERTAKRGFIIGGILILPAGFLCAMFGVIAAAKFPGLPKAAMALPTLVTQLSPLIGGIFLAALWAADISTAVALLMGCSTLVLEDVIKKTVYKKAIPHKWEMVVSRLVVLFVSGLSFLLALTVVGILQTITTALAITTSFTLFVIASMYFPKACKKAAGFPIVLASLVLWIIWTYFPQFRFGGELIYAEWAVCGVIFVICAIFCKKEAGRLVTQEEA
jgi:SSS family solute:Na+ symporter